MSTIKPDALTSRKRSHSPKGLPPLKRLYVASPTITTSSPLFKITDFEDDLKWQDISPLKPKYEPRIKPDPKDIVNLHDIKPFEETLTPYIKPEGVKKEEYFDAKNDIPALVALPRFGSPTPERKHNIKCEEIKKETSAAEKPVYRLDFGKHCGKTFNDLIQAGEHKYIDWLTRTDFSTTRRGLKEALDEFKIATSKKEGISLGSAEDFTPPNLSTAPLRFYDSGDDPLWININDARKYFGIKHGLRVLPRVEEKGFPKYWLYHVYELSKFLGYRSKEDAYLSLAEWLNMHEQRVLDVAESMFGGGGGYGTCCCRDGFICCFC